MYTRDLKGGVKLSEQCSTDAAQNDSKTAKKLSFAWLQSSTIEELELRLAIAGITSLDIAAEAWSRENKDMLKIMYKNFLDEKQKNIDLKKLMKSRSNATKLLPSKCMIEYKENTFRIRMYAIDCCGEIHCVSSNYFDENFIITILGGVDAFKTEIAYTMLSELAKEIHMLST